MEREREYIVDLSSGDSRIIKGAISEISAVKSTRSIVVSPLYVDMAALTIGGSRPEIVAQLSTMTYPEVTLLECALAVENGADVVEVAIYSGELAECGAEQVTAELVMISEEIDGEAPISLRIYGDVSSEQTIRQVVEIASQIEAESIKIIDKEADAVAEMTITLLAEMAPEISLKCNYSSESVAAMAEERGIELINVCYLSQK